ncbi:GNAT family N-acetyltransferase [Arthrobacter celericrescens]|uniref:GNAT family N-acetyltransferase n=1 Tax=Arthrobacter celericrescens TaxID=2320851 RepID=UPI001969341E|nr:GNAT family protein [Arthrobacter celericrescens]
MATTRLVTLEDAPVFAKVLTENRDFLAPWDPLRDDEFFTAETQHRLVSEALQAFDAGTMVPLAITTPDGGLAGRINIGGIVRGALKSGGIGYWVSQEHNGRGLATMAVAEIPQHRRPLAGPSDVPGPCGLSPGAPAPGQPAGIPLDCWGHFIALRPAPPWIPRRIHEAPQP